MPPSSPKKNGKDFDMGIGVSELVVARSGRDTSTGGYQYKVIFLEESGEVPQMLVSWDSPDLRVSKVLSIEKVVHEAMLNMSVLGHMKVT